MQLFVYGTLCDGDLRAAVLGRRLGADQIVAALAEGWQAVLAGGRDYPMLVHAPGAQAMGLLLLGLTAADFARLDAYEGAEYRLAGIGVHGPAGPGSAMAYLPVLAPPPPYRAWSLATWQVNRKQATLVSVGGPVPS